MSRTRDAFGRPEPLPSTRRYNFTSLIGETISHYRVLEKLGSGGMGEVWKAEDTQLRRTVALKFLSSETVGDDEVKARLIREAQASASLDHPNICQVFGIHEEQGETFIAMAYIDGPSLADRIKERPLPLDEALSVTTQIAEGLQEAHEKGIVHRDIKPQNVMLTAKGQVKIMDFGLARLAGRSKLTKSSTTLGTPSYMAPEQLEGAEADNRADLWSLGVVLYELLTQRTPFDADYEQAVAYGILNEEPEPLTALRSGLPVEIDRVIARSLAKNREERYQHADELLVDLRGLAKQLASEESKSRPAPATVRPPPAGAGATVRPLDASAGTSLRRLVWGLGLAVGVLLVALGALLMRPPSSTTQQSIELTIGPPPGTQGYHTFALSPDGRWLAVAAYTNRAGNQTELWVRPLSADEYRRLADTSDAKFPFWSPDSDQIGYFAEGKLLKVAVTGGGSQTLCDASNGRGGTWNRDGRILFVPAIGSLSQVSERGGEPEALIPRGDNEDVGRYPWFLPDGRRFISHFGGSDPASSVGIASLDEPGGLPLVGNASRGVYAPGGNGAADHVLFGRGGSILAQPVDRNSMELIGRLFSDCGRRLVFPSRRQREPVRFRQWLARGRPPQ